MHLKRISNVPSTWCNKINQSKIEVVIAAARAITTIVIMTTATVVYILTEWIRIVRMTLFSA